MLYCYVDEDSFFLLLAEFISEIDVSIVCLSVCPSLLGFLFLKRENNSKLVYDSFRI
jgi:hypothetical protein